MFMKLPFTANRDRLLNSRNITRNSSKQWKVELFSCISVLWDYSEYNLFRPDKKQPAAFGRLEKNRPSLTDT